MAVSLQELHNRAGGSAKGIVKYLRDYYDQEGGIMPPGQWLGKGAQALGLDQPGRSYDSDFKAILLGFDPNDPNRKLVQNAGEPDRTYAHDMTLSAPKGFSIAFAAADTQEQKRMLAALHHARDQALGFLDGEVRTRTGHGGKRLVAAEGLVVRSVTHVDSRAGDPQLHCHCVVANLNQAADGKWRALKNEDLYASQLAVDAIFQRELARGFMALGYGIDQARELDDDGRETGRVSYHVAGISREAELAFSTRRKQVLDNLQQAVDAGKPITKSQAALLGRAGKDEKNPQTIIDDTRKRLDDLRKHGHLIDWKDAKDLQGRPGKALDASDPETPLVEKLHETSSGFSRAEYVALMMKETPLDKAYSIADADAELAQQRDVGHVVDLDDDAHGRKQYCGRRQWDLEWSLDYRSWLRKDEAKLRLQADRVEWAIGEQEREMGAKAGQPVKLTDEQKHAIRHVCLGSGGVACIVGDPGTGKTATAGGYIKAFQDSGFRVVGTSTSNVATKNLMDEAGIAGYNTAALLTKLDNGKLKLDAKSVVLLDEAGMVDARTMSRLLAHVHDAGAKMVAVGDPKQLEAVGAGAPFRQLLDSLGSARLSERRRQKNPEEQRLAGEFIDGKASGKTLLAQMEATGKLVQDKHQVKRLAQDYLADPAAEKDKLVVVHTHADAAAVNAQIRAGLKGKSLDESQAATIETRNREGDRRQSEICVGERIRFTKNGGPDGPPVFNNDLGEVVGIGRKAILDKDGKDTGKTSTMLRVRMEADAAGKQREVEIDTHAYQRIDYAYARTVHSAQGLGVDSVFYLGRGGGNVDRNAGMVAMTRAKQNFRMYVSPAERQKIEASLDEWGDKQTAREMASKRLALEQKAPDLKQEAAAAVSEIANQAATNKQRQGDWRGLVNQAGRGWVQEIANRKAAAEREVKTLNEDPTLQEYNTRTNQIVELTMKRMGLESEIQFRQDGIAANTKRRDEAGEKLAALGFFGSRDEKRTLREQIKGYDCEDANANEKIKKARHKIDGPAVQGDPEQPGYAHRIKEKEAKNEPLLAHVQGVWEKTRQAEQQVERYARAEATPMAEEFAGERKQWVAEHAPALHQGKPEWTRDQPNVLTRLRERAQGKQIELQQDGMAGAILARVGEQRDKQKQEVEFDRKLQEQKEGMRRIGRRQEWEAEADQRLPGWRKELPAAEQRLAHKAKLAQMGIYPPPPLNGQGRNLEWEQVAKERQAWIERGKPVAWPATAQEREQWRQERGQGREI